jgi:hypothetical protein
VRGKRGMGEGAITKAFDGWTRGDDRSQWIRGSVVHAEVRDRAGLRCRLTFWLKRSKAKGSIIVK